MTATIGVLSLQGSFNEHIAALRRLGVKGVQVRKPEHLDNLRALIIPGGESTTMAKLAEYHNLVCPMSFLCSATEFPALREFVKAGKPVWGTCAGLIFLANKAVGQKTGGQELIGGLDCTVHRNFFGSQLESFEADLSVPELAANEGGPPNFRGVFIRAPAILEAGPNVEILAYYSVPFGESTSTEADIQEVFGIPHPLMHSFFLKMGKWKSEESLMCASATDSSLDDEERERGEADSPSEISSNTEALFGSGVCKILGV
ncbi:hypothetical protein Taro_048592 [Colocasia esculenta]|uniref:glutaminase n=1 Tax=Colocasia esculenta TaxID=4460 RepID=A0A843X8I3_COLES|nr:hypothetical protein [Colocasia esculenta]